MAMLIDFGEGEPLADMLPSGTAHVDDISRLQANEASSGNAESTSARDKGIAITAQLIDFGEDEPAAHMLPTVDDISKLTLKRISKASGGNLWRLAELPSGRRSSASSSSTLSLRRLSSGGRSESEQVDNLPNIRRSSVRRLLTASSLGLSSEQMKSIKSGGTMKRFKRHLSHGHVQTITDLVLLEKISQEAVVEVLQQRYRQDEIYTYIGNAVVSVNPYKQLNIYNEEFMKTYQGTHMFDPDLKPHIFALADTAYSDMKLHRRSQVIAISGESGSGKTEASKKIMQYIAAVSGGGSSDKEAIKDKLLKANTVLEAFGNAKTIRNDNASRFVKFTTISFDCHGNPVGGSVITHMLEKSRVVMQAEEERNFHVFYQLCTSDDIKLLCLPSDPMQYLYLKQGGVPRIKGIEDKTDWMEINDSLLALGFSEEQLTEMVQVLGGLLMLGQINLKPLLLRPHTVSRELEKAAGLLSMSRSALLAAVTRNTVVANGQLVTSELTLQQASFSCHTLAKAIYERLFKHIVAKINESLHSSEGMSDSVSVLDIYGFEVLPENSFEQFCINYCNEKLQQLFIEVTLKTEQQQYTIVTQEGITWMSVPFFDNKPICNMIEKHPGGVLSILDEECMCPDDRCDESLFFKLTEALRGDQHFGTRVHQNRSASNDRRASESVFVVHHYAGEVEYRVEGFLEKNIDVLFRDLSRGMFESKSKLLKELFPEGDFTTWMTVKCRPQTIGAAFKASMAGMMELLTSMNPSYVRCIKPNDQKKPDLFEELPVLHQVCYLGLVENIHVRRAGFCFRMDKQAFFMRFRVASPETYPSWGGSIEAGIDRLMMVLKIERNQLVFGKTMVFIRYPKTVAQLERARDERIESSDSGKGGT